MPSYSTVLFDLDGTLIDSVRLILDSYHHTLETHGLPARTDDHWLAGIGTPLWAQFAEWAQDQSTMDALIATYREYNLAHHDTRVAAYPGVVDAVLALHGAGLRIGLVTSKNRSGALRGLKLAGLEDVMTVIVGADEVQKHKPDPEPVLRALDLLGASAERTIYVGDSVHDMASGRAAGTATGAVLWGPFRREALEPLAPDRWFHQPAELLGLLRD